MSWTNLNATMQGLIIGIIGKIITSFSCEKKALHRAVIDCFVFTSFLLIYILNYINAISVRYSSGTIILFTGILPCTDNVAIVIFNHIVRY